MDRYGNATTHDAAQVAAQLQKYVEREFEKARHEERRRANAERKAANAARVAIPEEPLDAWLQRLPRLRRRRVQWVWD